MFDDVDLIGRQINTPIPPPLRQRQTQNIWDKLQSYVQNETRINIDTQALRRELEEFDEKILPIKSLRVLIGACVRGYQNKKGMQDPRVLDTIIDYLEILRLVLPTDISLTPKYMINLSAELVEDVDFLFDDKKLFVENIKEYVQLLDKQRV